MIVMNWYGKDNTKTGTFGRQLIWLALLIALWELLSRLEWVNPLILPSASAVAVRMISDLWEGTLALQLLQSIGLVLIGLAVGSLIGFILACLDYFLPFTRPLISLLSAMLHPLPGVAILPLVLAIAGLGLKSVFIVILHAIVWSSFLNISTGFRSVDPDYIDAALNVGVNRWELVWHILLPLSSQQIISGLKIGWSRGWRALISAEMVFSAIGALGGIGWYLFERRAFMDMTGLYAGICLIILTGVLIENTLFNRFDR